ncbi:GALA protein [Ralstonia pseudosolanacearum]|uniref:GALA protein n=1 Tax=Ralstonia pseudosolanacearum TaxID=1310165 RepID=UPI001FFA0096|nr:GALA protein [Ralstonia pseudosolanacearum]
MVKRTSNSPGPYIPPQPSAPPMPERGFSPERTSSSPSAPYNRPTPSAPPLPDGMDHRAYSPSRSSAGVASSPLGGLAAMRLNGGSAGTAPMRRGQLPPAPSRPPVAQNLEDLPAVALQNMASFLDPRSRRALSAVSKTMNEAARSSQTHMLAWNKKMLDQLHHYPKLQSLRLQGDITLAELKALPPTLRHLDLRGCTPMCGAKSLEAVRYLATLPLESLNLKDAPMVGDAGAALLAGNHALKKLTMSDCGISEVGARRLADHPSLESLDLSGNRIDARGAQHLATSESIKTLRLCCCGVTDPGIHALADNPRLTSLDVSGNRINDDALRHLAASPSLTMLDVSCNRQTLLGGPQSVLEGEEMAFALAETLAGREKPLASLKADGNAFGDFAAQMLAFPTIGTASLSLKSNFIGPEGAGYLAANPALQELDLTQNKIRDEGAQELAGSRSLKTLVLTGCLVNDAGAQALSRNRTLESLDLGNLVSEKTNKLEQEREQAGFDLTANEITEKGTRALAQSASLTSLSIQGNLCLDAGVLPLARNRKLTSLNVAFTYMTQESVRELANNPVLTSLSVRWNLDRIGPEGVKELAKSRSLAVLDARNAWMGEEGGRVLEANPRLTGPSDDPNFISEWCKD